MLYIELDENNCCTGNWCRDIPQPSFIKFLELESVEQSILDNIQLYKYINGDFVKNDAVSKRIDAMLEIDKYQEYLSQTDWMAIRFADEGTEIPQDVKVKRHEAREEISRLRELI